MPFLPGIDAHDKVPHVLAKFHNGTQIPLCVFPDRPVSEVILSAVRLH